MVFLINEIVDYGIYLLQISKKKRRIFYRHRHIYEVGKIRGFYLKLLNYRSISKLYYFNKSFSLKFRLYAAFFRVRY
jgi:hypothetical protein